MDEILQLSPIREGKLQEDLQTMLISNEKKVTIHSKINFSSLGTYKLLYTSDVVRRNAQWNLAYCNLFRAFQILSLTILPIYLFTFFYRETKQEK